MAGLVGSSAPSGVRPWGFSLPEFTPLAVSFPQATLCSLGMVNCLRLRPQLTPSWRVSGRQIGTPRGRASGRMPGALFAHPRGLLWSAGNAPVLLAGAVCPGLPCAVFGCPWAGEEGCPGATSQPDQASWPSLQEAAEVLWPCLDSWGWYRWDLLQESRAGQPQVGHGADSCSLARGHVQCGHLHSDCASPPAPDSTTTTRPPRGPLGFPLRFWFWDWFWDPSTVIPLMASPRSGFMGRSQQPVLINHLIKEPKAKFTNKNRNIRCCQGWRKWRCGNIAGGCVNRHTLPRTLWQHVPNAWRVDPGVL